MFLRDSWGRLLLVSTLALFPAATLAAPALSISSPLADGTFLLRGDQMTGVAGLEIRIGYDAMTLGNPRVTMGSLAGGMMSMVNPGNPIRVALIGSNGLGVNGSGIIASIAFDRTGASPGAITDLTGTLVDAKSNRIALPKPEIRNPLPAPAAGTHPGSSTGGSGADIGQEPGAGTAGTTDLYAARSRRFTLRELTGLPASGAEPQQKKDSEVQTAQPDEPPPPPEREEAAADSGREPAVAGEPEPVTAPARITSVLERFREFRGPRTAANLIALFENDPRARFTQVAPIAISDGEQTVTLIFALHAGEGTPGFACTASRYLSAGRNAQGDWEVEVLPDQGAVEASVSVLYNGVVQRFPLTVAPGVNLVAGQSRPVTEADFELYLKPQGKGGAAGLDLNRDGRCDYLDDYIFTANFLVQMEGQALRQKTPK